MSEHEAFVCDECGRQATRAEGTNWCVRCEREYQAGLNPPMRVPWPTEHGDLLLLWNESRRGG